MTDQEFAELCLLLDNVWDRLDEGREAGLQWVLGEEPYADVLQVVRAMCEEDRVWLPKPPEILARVRELQARRASEQRAAGLLERVRQRFLADA